MANAVLLRVVEVMAEDSLLYLQMLFFSSPSSPYAIWSRGKMRKHAKCALTGRELAPGDEAFMPVGNQSYRAARIHPDAFAELGWHKGRAVVVRPSGEELAPKPVMLHIGEIVGDTIDVQTSLAKWEGGEIEGDVEKVVLYTEIDGQEMPFIEYVVPDFDPSLAFHLGGD